MLLSKKLKTVQCVTQTIILQKCIYIKALFIVPCCIIIRQSIKKNIRGIRIKSVVYLEFEMQQNFSDYLSS